MNLKLARSLPWVLLAAACSATPPAPAPSRGAPAATSLAAPLSVEDSVRQLTARGPENVDVSPGRLPGSTVIRIRGGYSEVLLAKTNPDGTVSTGCVDSPAGADAFLHNPASASPAKAAQ